MLAKIIEWVAAASLAISAVQIYLIVNKLWRRKSDKMVAEAQSVTSNLLGLATGIPWIVKYYIEGELKAAVASTVWAGLSVFFTLVAIGVWVPATEKNSLWTKLKAALRLERREAGDLVMTFFRPKGAALILRILRQVAMIDKHLDPREKRFIDEFARAWGIPEMGAGDRAGGDENAGSYMALRASVEEYLAIAPPGEQVVQLREVLQALVDIDQAVAEQESLIMQEIMGMFDAHLAKDGVTAPHKVVLVPQNPEQDEAIRTLVRQATRISYRGGSAYVVGRFHSTDYARMVRDKYQALSFFTVIDSKELDDEAPAAAA